MMKSRWTYPAFLLVALVAWPVGTWAQGQVEHTRPGMHPAPHGAEHGAAKAHAEESDEPGEFNFAEFGKKDKEGKDQPPFIAVLINFAILAGAYYYFGKKPLADALKARKAEITKEIDEAQRIKREAEERAKEYDAKLKALEGELKTLRAALLDAGNGEKEALIAEANAKAERLAKDTQFLISQELKQQTQAIWRDAVETAVSAAEELLKVRVTQADQERLAEEFLRELGQKAPAPKAPEVTS